jgi:hypothetical protein
MSLIDPDLADVLDAHRTRVPRGEYRKLAAGS